jgi:predicted phage terminase large subunit-like protein
LRFGLVFVAARVQLCGTAKSQFLVRTAAFPSLALRAGVRGGACAVVRHREESVLGENGRISLACASGWCVAVILHPSSFILRTPFLMNVITTSLDRYSLTPTAKQALFLNTDELEVFYGGAAGGGKSVALLMGALKYIDNPGYAALILRKDIARMELAGGLIPRSHEWFRDTTARWISRRRQWIFENKQGRPPSTIIFGYLSGPLDKFRYASSEFQYIAFDELTDFTEEDYLFLFSRLRRNTSSPIPQRMRSASNPGGPGHAWVKQRFIPDSVPPAPSSLVSRPWSVVGNSLQQLTAASVGLSDDNEIFDKQGRFYIPSRVIDNEHLDAEEYRRSLMHLPVVERERLLNGDWTIQERALIQQKWLRYYVEVDGQLELLEPSGRLLQVLTPHMCRRFATVDPAGTSEERTREARGRSPSYTVMQVWEQPRRELASLLVLRHQVRERVGFNGLIDIVRRVHREWQPEQIWIEGEKLGRAVHDMLHKELPIECVSTRSQDKATRAGPLIVKFERGEVFLPKHNTTWRPDFESEALAWTGSDDQPSDQVDAAAYAAVIAGERHPRAIRVI